MSQLRNIVIGASAALVLAGCSSYDDGYGYGYGGVSLGYNSGGYYDDGYYGGYGGWYNGFYYPGTGYYVYDRRGARHRWNDSQRRYFEGRRYAVRDREDRRDFRQFRRDGRQDQREFRTERRDDRRALRNGEVSREAFREDRRADRQSYRAERKSDHRALRRDLRDRPRRQR